jgi:hypothetical protein
VRKPDQADAPGRINALGRVNAPDQLKPSTTLRVWADFFSIFVTTTAPTSAVLATWVPPQG